MKNSYFQYKTVKPEIATTIRNKRTTTKISGVLADSLAGADFSVGLSGKPVMKSNQIKTSITNK